MDIRVQQTCLSRGMVRAVGPGWSRVVLLAVAIVFSLLSGTASAYRTVAGDCIRDRTTVSSDLYRASTAISPEDRDLALRFTSEASGPLYEIRVAVGVASGSGDLDVSLATDDTSVNARGRPGQILETIRVIAPATPAVTSARSTLKPAMQIDQRYWIVLSAAGTQPSEIRWHALMTGFPTSRFAQSMRGEISTTDQWEADTNQAGCDGMQVTVGTDDADDDGVVDETDNCPTTPNTDQVNTDADGQGDTCDLDDDNDARADTVDNCSQTANGDQANFDADPQGDVCDPDDDNDGRPDTADSCPHVPATTLDGCPRSSAPIPESAPTLTLSASTAWLSALYRHEWAIRVGCAAASCPIEIEIRLDARTATRAGWKTSRSVVIGQTTIVSREGRTAVARVGLTERARKRLAGLHRLARVTVGVRAVANAGTTTAQVIHRRVTLKRRQLSRPRAIRYAQKIANDLRERLAGTYRARVDTCRRETSRRFACILRYDSVGAMRCRVQVPVYLRPDDTFGSSAGSPPRCRGLR